MKKEDITEALTNNADLDMAENTCKKKKRLNWLKWGILAACLVLIIGAVITLPALLQTDLSNVPLWDASHFPAERVVPLANNLMGGGTTGYTQVGVSDNNPLWLTPVPWGRYLRIYEKADVDAEPSEAELQAFADATIPKLAEAMDLPVQKYCVETPSENTYRVETYIAPYKIKIEQGDQLNYFKIYTPSDSDQPMVLDGNPVQVDISLSNKEILKSLEPIKKSLFEIFGVSFSDVEIRPYGGCSIFFYNESDHYLNEFKAISEKDRIHIQFKPGTTESNILTKVTLTYQKLRVDVDEIYPLVAKAEKLPLKDAEKLLEQGYTFTKTHFCGLCTDPEDGVCFDDYDYVGIEYISSKPMADGSTLLIPLYAFHKKISTDPDGNITYAKTYVPAIAVEDYEEYIDGVHKEHEEKAK